MSCCNHKRTAFKNALFHSPTIDDHHQSKEIENLKTVYKGRKSKTIFGAITKKRYHFRFYGQIIPIDERDISGITAEADVEVINTGIH